MRVVKRTKRNLVARMRQPENQLRMYYMREQCRMSRVMYDICQNFKDLAITIDEFGHITKEAWESLKM